MGGHRESRIDELLLDARAAFDRADWAEARAFTSAALALDAHHPPAAELLDLIERTAPPLGERRQLTVMFCDLVGSTRLSIQLDPEVVRDLLRAYQAVCDRAIRRYGGVIANYIGDGVLAYFGHPTPHEDDPRRAVKAGLELLDDLRTVVAEAKDRHQATLDVRVAVHTGMVVVADMGTAATPDRDAVVGDTPNIAARLQDAARPGSLVISGDTHDLVAEHVTAVPLGALQLKGIDHPVDAYEVVGERDGAGPWSAHGLTPFVGRDADLEELLQRWEEVEDGGSAVLVLRGEPGIGKSRLAFEARRRILAGDGTEAACQCSAYHTTTQLYAIRRLVEAIAGVDTSRDPETALRALRDQLAAAGQESSLPLVASMLDLPPTPWCPPVELEGTRRRDATFAALLDWVAASAAIAPLLLVIEDVQWADASTMDLLSAAVVRRIPGLMVLLTARDEVSLPWSERSVTVVDLQRLGGSDLDRIARSLPQAARIPRGQLSELIDHSDGIPLFLEELVRSRAVDSGRAEAYPSAPTSDIPPALRDRLLARFAAPGVDLDLAQVIATVGHEVAHDLLCDVVGLDGEALAHRIAPLVEANLLDVGDGDPPTYRFHHHLLGQLAYETQLLPERRDRHRRIADLLRDRGERGVPADAGAEGYHRERGGQAVEAIEAYVRSARRSQSHGGHAEATTQLTHALGLLDQVASEAQRLRLELLVRDARGFSATSTLGYAAPGAAEDYERCRQIIQRMEVSPDDMGSLYGVFAYYLLHGDLDRAEELLVIDRARGSTHPDVLPEEFGWGMTRLFRGEYPESIADLRTALTSPFVREQVPLPDDWPVPNDPVGALWSVYAVALVVAGEDDGVEEALERAEERAGGLPFPYGPFTLAFAKGWATLVHSLRGDTARAAAANAEELALGERHGFTFFTVLGSLQRAWMDSLEGAAGARDRLAGSLAMWRALGAELWVPTFLTGQAHAALADGDAADALALCHEAQEVAARTGNLGWASETTRLIGECRLAQGDAGGLDDLRAAVSIGASQGARLLELRAAIALCRATDDSHAHKYLAQLIETFPEGAARMEREQARAVLDETSTRP